ncbi:MAG: FAD-binding oxidoreductase, partial [Beijerinckiaceae bacterium]|nr:FAD-binding oxidoreductase [Beijerinckiaceae bacterium]
IDGATLRDLEPALSKDIRKAAVLPDNRTVRDPLAIVERLTEILNENGTQVITGEVTDVERGEGVNRVRLADGRTIQSDHVVICAGAHSATLAARLGEPIPLETERGYSTQIMDPGVSLNHSIIWPAKAFMVSPTAGGIRVGGTVEMAGLEAAPNYQRAKITVRSAKAAVPDLKVAEATEWMGHRPALPDTIPILSASAKTKGVFYATGHGHLGLTLAATTARLMGQLIAGNKTDISLTPYRIDRF